MSCLKLQSASRRARRWPKPKILHAMFRSSEYRVRFVMLFLFFLIERWRFGTIARLCLYCRYEHWQRSCVCAPHTSIALNHTASSRAISTPDERCPCKLPAMLVPCYFWLLFFLHFQPLRKILILGRMCPSPMAITTAGHKPR